MELRRFFVSRTRALGALLVGVLASGCGTPPPASQVPSARDALNRLHASQDCGLGVQASAKIDHFGEKGRVRAELLLFAMWPARLRMDVVSPFGVALATLTADEEFALMDLREKKFFTGPASACNIARLTTVPMPGHVLVSLLRGEAPVLKHDAPSSSIGWSKKGFYVVKLTGKNQTEETLHLAPHPDDFGKPWGEQRLRVVEVEVKQEGIVLYHAQLEGHGPAEMAKERVDPDGIDPPVPPSGPMCHADLPRTIHLEVPGKDQDVLFRYDKVTWNPPVVEGLFTQPVPGGLEVVRVSCDR